MANIRFCFNNVGWNADVFEARDGAISTGYDINDIISGPRSNYVRADADTTGVLAASYQVTDYDGSPTKFLEAETCHIIRFDKILHHRYATDEMRFSIRRYREDVAGFSNYQNYTPFGPPSDWLPLHGPHGQDYGWDLGSPEARSCFEVYFLHHTGSTSWSIELHGLYFSNPWDPGTSPELQPKPQWTNLPAGSTFTPQRGGAPYDVEARIRMTWKGITDTQRDLFPRDDFALNWPLVLLDASQTLWQYVSEHVIIDSYTWSKQPDGSNDLEMSFYRLRHYP